jgi:hypothetical protein
MKTNFFRNNAPVIPTGAKRSGGISRLTHNATIKASAHVSRCLGKLGMTVLLLCPVALSAQNGVTVSNLNVDTGTVTFDVSWKNTDDMPSRWSDTVWVFVDYNAGGMMKRLPLRIGSSLTVTSADGEGQVIEVPGNDQGVWVAGNARSAENFSATVQLLSTVAEISGACVYASNYPPVGRYTTATNVSFTGTPIYKIVLEETGGSGTLTEYSDGLYTIRAGYSIKSFTDATGAPGTFHCAMPATQTLRASATGYCEDAAGVQFALGGTQSGVVYQLYRDNAPLSGATLTDSGSAATFSGTFTAGVYRVESLPGASCPAAMDGTHTITMYPVPAPPAITGPKAACNTATLVAVPGDHGNGILWSDNSTNPARIVTSSNNYTAVSTSAYGCQSGSSSFSCTISFPSAAGAAPDPLCCCSCGLSPVDGTCVDTTSPSANIPSHNTCTISPSEARGWHAGTAQALCPSILACKNKYFFISYRTVASNAYATWLLCTNDSCTSTSKTQTVEAFSQPSICWK